MDILSSLEFFLLKLHVILYTIISDLVNIFLTGKYPVSPALGRGSLTSELLDKRGPVHYLIKHFYGSVGEEWGGRMGERRIN
jgi:hypothetical protein